MTKLEGNNDFQQRIPNPAIAGMQATVDAIFEPYNNDLYNTFTQLLNGIFNTYVYDRVFYNPLRELKKPMQRAGFTERYVATKWLQGHSFNYGSETLLKLRKPEYVEWFFSKNYSTRYEFSFSRTDVRTAFSEEGYGFNELLQSTLDAQISSDNYDEMNAMIQVFAEADSKWGLYRENLSATPTDKATAQELLTKLRAYAKRLTFPSMLYNAIPVPVFETQPELSVIFWCTPEVDAVIDVMALADLFNIEKADVSYKKIVIPEFPIPNVVAALSSDEFIYMRDFEYGVYPFWNPETLTDTYFLHHQAAIGANPAANCILFTTEEGTNVPTVEIETSGFAFVPDTLNISLAEGCVKLNPVLSGTVTEGYDDVFGVEPDACMYTIAGTRTVSDETVPIPLNAKTRVDKNNVLWLQKSDIEVGDVLTVTGISVYINPSGETTAYTDTCTVTVVA